MIKNNSIKSVINNIGWLIFDKLLILLMNIIIIFIVANFYGPKKYGVYQYATNIVLILEVIVQLVDGRVVKKKYSNGNYNEVVFSVTIAKVLLSSIALFSGVLIVLLSSKEIEFSYLLIVLLFDSIIRNIRFGLENRFEYILQSKKIVIASNIGLMVGTLLQLMAVYMQASIILLAVIQMCSTLISYIILLIQYKNTFGEVPVCHNKYNKILIKEIIKESTPLAIATAAATIYTRCDSVMLGMLLTTKEVGIYSISSKFISTIQMLVVPIQTTIFVKMLEWKDKPRLYEDNYIKITSIATWLSIIGVAMSFVVLPFIFKFLKPDYLPALESYKILSLGSILTYNAILRSSHFTIIGRGDILMKTQIITVVVNVLLNYFLIRNLGMNGAAIATVIAQIISLLISNLFFKDAKFVFKVQLLGFNPRNIIKLIN